MNYTLLLYVLLGFAGLVFVLFIIETIFLIIILRKTYAVTELKAWFKGYPLCAFYEDTGYVDIEAIKPEAGIVERKGANGSYIINKRGTYVMKKNKVIMVPFDAAIAASANIRAARLAQALQVQLNDDREMFEFRKAVMNGELDENETVNTIKESVEIGAIKGLVTAMLPHNITSKIEKVVTLRLRQLNKPQSPWPYVWTFLAIFGAILLGYLVIKLAGGSGNGSGVMTTVASSIAAPVSKPPSSTQPPTVPIIPVESDQQYNTSDKGG